MLLQTPRSQSTKYAYNRILYARSLDAYPLSKHTRPPRRSPLILLLLLLRRTLIAIVRLRSPRELGPRVLDWRRRLCLRLRLWQVRIVRLCGQGILRDRVLRHGLAAV
jgi:hypothetical protein